MTFGEDLEVSGPLTCTRSSARSRQANLELVKYGAFVGSEQQGDEEPESVDTPARVGPHRLPEVADVGRMQRRPRSLQQRLKRCR